MQMSKQLMSIMIHKASREEKLAFFINIYNTLMIHGCVAYGIPGTIWQRWKVWQLSHVIDIYNYYCSLSVCLFVYGPTSWLVLYVFG